MIDMKLIYAFCYLLMVDSNIILKLYFNLFPLKESYYNTFIDTGLHAKRDVVLKSILHSAKFLKLKLLKCNE
jgi:hypothetical protein